MPQETLQHGEVVSTWLPHADAAALRARAAAADRSIAAELRRALRPYLSRTSEAALAGGSATTTREDDARHGQD